MTCREVFYMTHAEMESEDAAALLKKSCPDYFGYAVEPEYCIGPGKACVKCWNRECNENVFLYKHITEAVDKYISEKGRKDKMEAVIKDSGNRREFESGAVRDMQEGKGRMDLLPWAAIMEVSKHCENGAKKYGEHNVDKGLPTSSFCDSGARHLAKYLDGWTDEPHLLAAAWNLLWAIQMEIKHPEVVDTPWTKKEDTTNTPLE